MGELLKPKSQYREYDQRAEKVYADYTRVRDGTWVYLGITDDLDVAGPILSTFASRLEGRWTFAPDNLCVADPNDADALFTLNLSHHGSRTRYVIVFAVPKSSYDPDDGLNMFNTLTYQINGVRA